MNDNIPNFTLTAKGGVIHLDFADEADEKLLEYIKTSLLETFNGYIITQETVQAMYSLTISKLQHLHIQGQLIKNGEKWTIND